MTSTPVSLNDESLNGSWIDINSASQINSPHDDGSPEFLQPPHSIGESVQSLGLISYQVERFLQEAQRNHSNNNSNNNQSQPKPNNIVIGDNISDVYLSDTDISLDGTEGKAMISSLKRHHEREKSVTNNNNTGNSNFCNNESYAKFLNQATDHLSKSGDCLADQLSDSLSLLSRTSAINEHGNFKRATSYEDFDWLWDWAAQPEYFTGQEWKVHTPKQDYLMKQRRLYCANLSRDQEDNLFSSDMISLLFLTNILSIIVGAGLTYSILMNRHTP